MTQSSPPRISKLPIPTPFMVGDVNVFLVQAARNVLIDTGPETEEAWNALGQGLAAHGLSPGDIDRVFITHGHEDHYGLAARLAEFGAEVFFPERDLPPRMTEGSDVFYHRELSEAGVPSGPMSAILENLGGLARYGRLPQSYVGLLPGTRVDLGEGLELEVLAAPGHTPGHVAFYARSLRVLFAGDAVISNITPNPILSRDPGRPARRFPGLRSYLETLVTLSRLPLQTVYCGHRGELTEVGPYADRARRFHAERQDEILELLTSDPHTVYTLAMVLFSGAGRSNVFLAVSETLAHLDYLEEAGRVVSHFDQGQRYYAALGGRDA